MDRKRKDYARDRQELFDPIMIERIVRSFYVDDILKSIIDVSTGKFLIKQLIEATRLGGNKLTKFVSNNKELLQEIPQDLISTSSISAS